MAKIGIHGFGRLGRSLLKVALHKAQQKGCQDVGKVVMVNEPNINTDCLSYILRNDTFYGKCKMDIVEMGSSLVIEGIRIEITTERDISKIPWSKNKVQYVIDTTGHHQSCNEASAFLTAGVKRVIVTGCNTVPIFIFGVNHCCYELDMQIISAGTPCMNCLVPLLKVVHENFEIEKAISCTLRPLSNSDNILDGMHGPCCRGCRASIGNFYPCVSKTLPKFIDKIMPELEGRTESTALKIPVPIVGALNLTAQVNREAPYEILKCRLKEASETYMKGIIRYSDELLISSDLIGDTNSCIIDGQAGKTLGKCMTTIFSWFESEVGFANRIFDLANYISSRESCTPKK